MPMPSVEPMPRAPSELRLAEPLEAHEASYFAASARIASLACKSIQPSVLELTRGGGARFAYVEDAGGEGEGGRVGLKPDLHRRSCVGRNLFRLVAPALRRAGPCNSRKRGCDTPDRRRGSALRASP